MAVDHDLIIGGAFCHVFHMVYHPLGGMMLRAGNHCAYISGLHCVVTVLFHKPEGGVELALIIHGVCRRLMMHDQLHTLRFRIIAEIRQIEIGIRLVEEELAVLAVACPVFPSFVPSLHKDSVDVVGGREVNVTFHVFRVGRVSSVRFKLGIVGHAGFGAVVVGICPCAAVAHKHLPPNAYEFHRFDPGGVFNLARLVEVKDKLGCKNVAGVVAHNHRSPGSGEGELKVSGCSVAVGHEVRLEVIVLGVHVEKHHGIFRQCRFMKIYVNVVCRLEKQGRLHDISAGTLAFSVPVIFVHRLGEIAESSFRPEIFVGVVVARDAEEGMVVSEIELRGLTLQSEIVHIVLKRQFIAEAEAVVEYSDAENHLPVRIIGLELYGQFLVVVTDFGIFAPHGFPYRVGGSGVDTDNGKTLCEVGFVAEESEAGFRYKRLPLVFHGIDRSAGGVDIDLHLQ